MAKFSKFNKQRMFTIDTSSFDYVTLEDLYTENGPDHKYCLRGLYIGTKSNFDPEVPIAAIDGTYVNLPVHQLEEVKNILADKSAVAAINAGEAGFIINQYEQKRYSRTCYSAEWIDYDGDDAAGGIGIDR